MAGYEPSEERKQQARDRGNAIVSYLVGALFLYFAWKNFTCGGSLVLSLLELALGIANFVLPTMQARDREDERRRARDEGDGGAWRR